MTMDKLTKILNAHGIVYERFTSISVKAYTIAYSDGFDVLEVIDGTLYINGSTDCNILEWLGY